MTVSTTTTTNSYSGNASTVAFAYTFKIFATGEMVVILRAATGTETVQTATTHYSVSGVGAASGGTVTFVTAPATGVTVLLKRASEQSQSTDYVENDPFPAATHEDALDKLTHISQELQEEVDRSIKLSRTNTMTSTEFTDNAAARASKVLAFDSSGELSVTQELGTFTGNWAASTAYSIRDLIKDNSAGKNNIWICITAHTSSGSLPIDTNTDVAKWALIVDATSATASAAAAVVSAQLADDWAVKTSGVVADSEYSSKAYSIGGTGITDTSGKGAAKEWATEAEDNTVDGTSYSAKHHAIKGAASAAASATSATASASSATTSTAQAVISTAQAVISTAQAVISTTKAGEAATSATASAASATAAASSAAAAEAVPMAIALG